MHTVLTVYTIERTRLYTMSLFLQLGPFFNLCIDLIFGSRTCIRDGNSIDFSKQTKYLQQGLRVLKVFCLHKDNLLALRLLLIELRLTTIIYQFIKYYGNTFFILFYS